MKLKSKILIIAGSDSSGGAGIQADIKTATCLGVYSMTALTAVTIQNTKGIRSVVSIPADEIYNQIIHTTKDIKPIQVMQVPQQDQIYQQCKRRNWISGFTATAKLEVLSRAHAGH